MPEEPFFVHTGDGRSIELTRGSNEGFWDGTDNAAFDFYNYWYFTACGQFSQGEDWWIYDADVNETSPLNQNDLTQWAAPHMDTDSDGDGLPDWFEQLIGTRRDDPDSDGDGMPDIWEVRHHLNPLSAADGNADSDGDGLTNKEEFDLGLNPNLRDTDGDGIDDKDEITMGMDPLHPFEHVDPSELNIEINLILE